MEIQARKKQSIKGVVKSDKMKKTRIIELQRSYVHPLYFKKEIRHSRVFVHDEKEISKIGDTIIAVSTRPLSRHKHFRLQKVLVKGAAS